MRFIGFTISAHDLDLARHAAASWRGTCCENYYGQDWRIRGVLSEQVFARRYPKAVRVNCLSHDFLLGRKLIEIKSRQITRLPHPSNVVGVLDEDVSRIHPQAILVFVIIKHDWRVGWLAGWITMESFLRIARRLPAGSKSGVVTYIKANREVTVAELQVMNSLLA